jgi:class 3 adenylate cyclase
MSGGELPRRALKRVERTFAFLDLCGFTAYTDEKGDAAAYDVISKFRTAVRQVASERGVRLAKWLGDGVMMIGVEQEDLVEAVIDIEYLVDESRSPLPMRAGIARGRVLLIDGDDHVGSAVILASRLCDRAEPHQILAQAGTVSLQMVNAVEISLGREKVPGFGHEIEIVQLTSPGGH